MLGEICLSTRDTSLLASVKTASLQRHALQHFLLSSVNHLRYTYVRAVLPIPTPPSARLMGLGRVSDDL